MSDAPLRSASRAEPLVDRLQPWIAALASALLHLLFLLALLYSSTPTLTPPDSGSSSGGRVKVDFIGQTRQDDRRPPSPPPSTPAPRERTRPRKPVVAAPVTSPVQSTRVTQADDPVPPNEKPQPAPSPPEEAAAQRPTQAPAASPPTPAWRRSATWGQPPGLLPEDTAPTNAGLDRGAARRPGRGRDVAAGEPSMEVGGYQIYYDLQSETRLRTWRDQGMTELSFPLPGISQYMVCALEIVMRRGSGGCRLVEPDAPEMGAIGDAREVVSVIRVYRRGELVWRGPGPYR